MDHQECDLKFNSLFEAQAPFLLKKEYGVITRQESIDNNTQVEVTRNYIKGIYKIGVPIRLFFLTAESLDGFNDLSA